MLIFSLSKSNDKIPPSVDAYTLLYPIIKSFTLIVEVIADQFKSEHNIDVKSKAE